MNVCELLHIDHVVLRARDPEGLVAFYRRVLGCTEERRVPKANGLIQLRAGGSLIDIVNASSEAPGPDGEGNMDHFCVRIAPTDMRTLEAKLLDAGFQARFAERVYGADGYGQSVYLQDPEGNTIELKGPPV